MSSVLKGSKTTLFANLCRTKRYFKPYQTKHGSVTEAGEKGKNPLYIDQKISMKFARLSSRAGGRGFLLAIMNMALSKLNRKIEEK